MRLKDGVFSDLKRDSVFIFHRLSKSKITGGISARDEFSRVILALFLYFRSHLNRSKRRNINFVDIIISDEVLCA
jgi:hypothetical protein